MVSRSFQQPLGDAGAEAGGGAPAMAFQVELVFEGVVDRLDPLADPADRTVPGRLVAPQPRARAHSPCSAAGIRRIPAGPPAPPPVPQPRSAVPAGAGS